MRATLNALTAELRRLKTTGVTTVSVGDESLAMLRKLVDSKRENSADTSLVSTSSDVPTNQAPPLQRSQLRQRATPPRKEVKQDPLLPPPPVFELPEGEKQARWESLQKRVEADETCQSQLRKDKKLVVGVGSLDADVFFCGDAPGAEEETAGEPFIGPAGQLLTKMIGAMGIKRPEAYIGNIMNWRPQMPEVDGATQIGNRPPTAEELAYCLPYLRAQVDIVQPRVIVALGATAARGLLGKDSFKALGEIRGKWHKFGPHDVIVTYHPSYILRNQSNRSKRMIWEDFLQVMERIELEISAQQRGYFQAR
jgi:uracil-DNA glycosylase family 4